MKSSILTTFGSLAAVVSSAAVQVQQTHNWVSRCGVEKIPEASRRFVVDYNKSASVVRRDTITIDTYVHLLNYENSPGQNQGAIDGQIQAFNDRFASAGFQFNVVESEEVLNDTYAEGTSDEADADMRTALHKGTYSSLNIYYRANETRYAGVATFPKDAPDNNDGVICAQNTMTGVDPSGPLALGMTTVHEVGHWLNLYHVFEASLVSDPCLEDGDLVPDTPFQKDDNSYVCPPDNTAKSCPNTDGFDSIHNYMDYSTDQCMTEFTPDQITRMTQAWDTFRSGK